MKAANMISTFACVLNRLEWSESLELPLFLQHCLTKFMQTTQKRTTKTSDAITRNTYPLEITEVLSGTNDKISLQLRY